MAIIIFFFYPCFSIFEREQTANVKLIEFVNRVIRIFVAIHLNGKRQFAVKYDSINFMLG
jgi:hypothetical protein